MNLDRYRIPAAVREGVWIELPDAGGAKFLVRLPAASNRAWQREMLQRMAKCGVQITADGAIDANAPGATEAMFRWQDGRLDKFLELCVMKGPDGFDLSSLADEFRPALQWLFDRAEALAEEETKEADDAGKS